jgi:uncharacterized membrane protein YccC
MASSATPSETGRAVRVATAATLCLLAVEWLHLRHGNLAVWTTHMVMAQYAFSAFQKGIERILGRGLGLVAGLLLLPVAVRAPVVGVLLMSLLLWIFFYCHFSGWLAYTFLNAGLYLAVIVEIGRSHPDEVMIEAQELFVAICLGVVIAEVVNWISRAEADLSLHISPTRLWPLEGERVRHSIVLVVTVLAAQLATRLLDLPTSTALVSVMLLTIAPDLQSLIAKGRLRVLGAVLAAAWAAVAWLLLSHVGRLAVLALLLFLGMCVAAYVTRAGGRLSYVGLQMGLVLPMILVVPPAEFGSLEAGLQRLLGVAIALAASLLVGGVAAAFGMLPATPPRGS